MRVCIEMLIAVVDDDAMVRAALVRFLRASGFLALAFRSGEEFLGWSYSQRPGCAVVDMDLPGLNGLEILERLGDREEPVPCILITGWNGDSTRGRAMSKGAVAFIRKPVEAEELLSALSLAVSSCGR